MRVLSEEEQVKRYKLDKKDKKILAYLCHNVRLPLSKVAKLVGLSRNSIEYRVKQMEKAHLIAGSRAVINIRALDYFSYHVFVQIHNTKDEKAFIERCISNDSVNALIGYCGKWDYEISIMAKDPAEFSTILDGLTRDINIKFCSITTILSTLKGGVLPSIETALHIDHVRNDPSFSRSFAAKKTGGVSLDAIDIRILHMLADDASLSLSKLGDKLKLTSDVVAYRIRKLIQQDIILQFRPVIDYSILGLTVQGMLVKGRIPDLKSFVQADKNVLWCAETVGNWDYIIYVITENPEEFHDFSRKIKEKFDQVLQSYELLFAYKDYKYSFMSKNVGL